MSDVPPGLLAILESKNAEVKAHHLEARIGMLQGTRVQDVRDVLHRWVPTPGSTLHELWLQVHEAISRYEDEIAAIRAEARKAIPGVIDPGHSEDPT